MLEHIEKRIQGLAKLLPDNTVVLVPGAPIVYRNLDVDFHFRQYSDFAYLTDWYYPDAWWLLRKQGRDVKVILCCQDLDPNI